MSVIVVCRRCGREFAPDRRAILAGRWRLCPACRDPEPPGGAAGRPPERVWAPAGEAA